ncbi:MAG: hypothetical protein R3B13_18485 [Polyangiaceae bacterium]
MRGLWCVVLLTGCASAPSSTVSEPSQPEPPAAPSTAAPSTATPPPTPTASAEDAAAPQLGASAIDAGFDATPDAVAEEPPPLKLAGARRCTEDELEREWCVQGRRAGECLEGFCVSPKECGAYCKAFAEREYRDCDPKDLPEDCNKNVECARDTKQMRATCRTLRSERTKDCTRALCERIKQMPPPPR